MGLDCCLDRCAAGLSATAGRAAPRYRATPQWWAATRRRGQRALDSRSVGDRGDGLGSGPVHLPVRTRRQRVSQRLPARPAPVEACPGLTSPCCRGWPSTSTRFGPASTADCGNPNRSSSIRNAASVTPSETLGASRQWRNGIAVRCMNATSPDQFIPWLSITTSIASGPNRSASTRIDGSSVRQPGHQAAHRSINTSGLVRSASRWTEPLASTNSLRRRASAWRSSLEGRGHRARRGQADRPARQHAERGSAHKT